MKAIFTILLMMIVLSGLAFSQEEQSPGFLKNEVSFGLGVAHSFETTIFNIQDDAKAGTNLGFCLDYFYNLNEKWALGVSMYGYSKTVDDFWILADGNLKKTSLDLLNLNIAAVGRYTFTRGQIESYAIGQLSYSSGSLENKDLGKLNLSGVSAGIGGGVGIPLSEIFLISLEAVASFGTATWKEKPFLNSSSTDYNPSLIFAVAKISYCFD